MARMTEKRLREMEKRLTDDWPPEYHELIPALRAERDALEQMTKRREQSVELRQKESLEVARYQSLYKETKEALEQAEVKARHWNNWRQVCRGLVKIEQFQERINRLAEIEAERDALRKRVEELEGTGGKDA